MPVNDTGWVETYYGRKVYPLEPDPDTLCIEDIAHALSLQCRYNGHTPDFYSVAQHSVLASYYAEPNLQRAALLHDAAEAYISDVPSPLKKCPDFKAFNRIEDNLLFALADKFDFQYPFPAAIHAVDKLLLALEYRDVFKGMLDWAPDLTKWARLTLYWLQDDNAPRARVLAIPELWSPKQAEAEFLARWEELC